MSIAHRRGAGDLTHSTLQLLFLGLLIGGTVWVLSPFLTAILWATIITVATWPLLLRLDALLGRRGLAVATVTLAILLVVVVPVTLAVTTIVAHARDIGDEVRSLQGMALPAPPEWLAGVPFVGVRVTESWKAFDALDPQQRSAAVTPYIQSVLQWFVAKAGSVGGLLLQFLVTTVVSAVLFANGELVRDGILRFAHRLGGQQGRDVALLAARAMRGVVLGVVVTALGQAAIGGAGLWIAGVPGWAFLTAVMLFLCMAQLGPVLVMLPAVVWLFWSGQAMWGTVLAVIGLVAATVDNIVRPILIRRGVDLPLILIFAGVLGGLIAFGVVGLFIGPVILTVSLTLLRAWMSEPAAPDTSKLTGELP